MRSSNSARRADEYLITKLRGEWAIAWRERGQDGQVRRRRYALGTPDRIVAETKARHFWQRRKLGSGETVGDIVEAWLNAHEHLVAAARNQDAWKAAKDFWSGLKPGHIDEGVCRSYSQRRAKAPRTIRYEIEIVRRAMGWAYQQKIIDTIPRFWKPAVPDRVVRSLTKDEFRTFLDGCSAEHIKLFARIGVATGARAMAILDLQWSQVDFDRRIISLNKSGRVQTAKKRAVVPINDQLLEALLAAKAGAVTDWVIEHGGDRIHSIKKGFGNAAARSGLSVTPHMLRHSAAVWMAEAGRPMAEIAQYLGHDDQRTTERVYARFSPDFLRGAAACLEF